MIIMGLDPSKSTGWAIYNPAHRSQKYFGSAVRCGVFEMPKGTDHYYTGDQIGLKCISLLRDCKAKYGQHPDFAVFEQQKQSTFGNKGFDGIVYPWIATTAIVAILSAYGIPYGTLTDSQWREKAYGKGFKPPQKPVMKDGVQEVDKYGRLKFANDWKEAAVTRCDDLSIDLPSKKTIAHNACEAALISICWRHKEMHFHANRYRDAWLSLASKNDSWSRLDEQQSDRSAA